MNNSFLSSYTIPIKQNNDESCSNNLAEYSSPTYFPETAEGSVCNSTPLPSNRFIPPGKDLKRKYDYTNSFKKKFKIHEVPDEVNSSRPFIGRDDSYPSELNALIHPLECKLCVAKMNSRASSKDHYESKNHDKKISMWIKENYTDQGMNPPELKRFYKTGPSGPDAFHCEACDIPLTSLAHANQHYSGKRHQLVIAQRSKPTGTGFLNSEGKWIRTGGKTQKTEGTRFGIGEAFAFDKFKEDYSQHINESKANEDKIKAKEIETPVPKKMKIDNPKSDSALFCSICNITVTSATTMTTHLSGIKHLKKLKALDASVVTNDNEQISSSTNQLTPGLASPISSNNSSSIQQDEKISADLTMFRTPSGQYYCKPCNISMCHLAGLQQHLSGKRHSRNVAEEKAMANLKK